MSFFLPNKQSFRLIKTEKKSEADLKVPTESVNNVKDEDKRLLLKILGGAGLGLFVTSLLPSKAEALIMGSAPTSNVVGIRDASNVKINPATEETVLSINTKIDQKYAFEVDDYSTTNITYIGKANIGSATASALWQIQKIDETTGTSIIWADGNSNFDNVWDNRLSLSYS